MRGRILYLAKIYLLTVLIFMAAKLVFMLCNHAVSSFSVSDILAVLWHGLALDLSTALYFLILPFLVTMVCAWVKLPMWLLKPYYALVAVLFALAFVVDTSMYPFWHFKLDASWLQYLETPTEAMASVSMWYLMVRILFFIFFTVLFFLAYDKIGMPSALRGSWKEQLFYIVLMPFMVIGIRGGVGESVTNIGQVYYSQNQFLNHSAINPVFNFFDSLTSPLDDLSQYQFFEPEVCEKIVNGVYTTESLHYDTLLTNDRPNILVILLESAGEQFASAMPHLQAMKKEGIYFSRCYANSWRTDRGTLCALSVHSGILFIRIPRHIRFIS